MNREGISRHCAWALGLVIMSAAGTATAAADPAATACSDGIAQALPRAVARARRIVQLCAKEIPTSAAASECIARALAAFAAGQDPSGMGAALQGVLDEFGRKIGRACSGADRQPNTADDVTGSRLTGALPGLEFHTWGAELSAALLPAPRRAADASAAGLNILIEEGCLTTEPVDVWMQKAPLQRLADTLECLALSSGVALAKVDLGIVSETMEPVKSRIVPAGVVYDAGADLLPLGAPDGINDTSAMPETTACSDPGLGHCVDAPQVLCSLGVGAGEMDDPSQCPGPSHRCIEALKGPDGITAADVPTETLDEGRCRVRFISSDPTDKSDAVAQVQCFIEGVRDRAGNLVSSNFSGTCNDGPRANLPCSGNADCGTGGPSQVSCLSGDEHVCEFDGVRISNPDNVPACGDECVGVLAPGPKSVSCGKSGQGFCFISRCVGGDRDGQLCAIPVPGYLSLTCPGGGTCLNLGKVVPYTGDEVGFYFRNVGGMGYAVCPVAFRWDAAFDVLNGAGWVTHELTSDPINLCAPSGTAIQAMGCWVHEGAGAPPEQLANAPWWAGTHRFTINFYTGQPTQGSSDGLPCPNAGLPIPASVLGVPFQIGVGPVIGVSGGVMP